MVTYTYKARDPVSGKKISGEIQADNEQEVSKFVKDQDYALLEVKIKDPSGFSFTKDRVTIKEKVIFSRQLSTLINAGLPLVQSLRSVLNQTKNRALQAILLEIITDIEAGKTFSSALEKHPKVFNQVFTSLVAAGEASGMLDTALERLANQQEKDAEIISKVRGAMVYPVIVLVVMVAVVGFMLVSVLPQVQELYDNIPGTTLPIITRVLLAVSNFIIAYWWIITIIVVVLGAMTTRWARTIGGKRAIDGLKLNMWPFAELFKKMYMARFTRTSTTLVASGVPLIQVLDITSDAVSNVYISDSIKQAIEKVKGGKALSASLSGDPNFLDLVPQMLKIGEDSGAIEQMLGKTADYYEKEVDNTIKSISTVIEPVLMVVLGVVAIVIVSAILLPIYGLVGQNVF